MVKIKLYSNYMDSSFALILSYYKGENHDNTQAFN